MAGCFIVRSSGCLVVWLSSCLVVRSSDCPIVGISDRRYVQSSVCLIICMSDRLYVCLFIEEVNCILKTQLFGCLVVHWTMSSSLFIGLEVELLSKVKISQSS